MLTFIGLGLADPTDVSVKGLDAIRNADVLYLESYTSILQCSVPELEKFYGKKIILADRQIVEQKAEETILADAKQKKVCFLVIGDVFSATTHTDIFARATELTIKVDVIHNASVMTAIGASGLSIYKFGKTTSIPFENANVDTPYNYLEQNSSIGAHTLMLLDLRPDENKFLSIPDAITYLLNAETRKQKNLFTPTTMCVALARLGSNDQIIAYGPANKLAKKKYGKPPYCLIVPGPLHFMEEEFLDRFSQD